MATLKARLREESGKGAARKMRASGEIPAVAYGHGQDARSLAVDAQELENLLSSINAENTIIDLEVDGGEGANALIREVQRHPSRPQVLHVDFFQVRAGEKLHVEVPIHFNGTPVGVADEGGILQEALRELSVECIPSKIPQSVEVNVEHLGIGDTIHIYDLDLEDVTILHDPDIVLCSVVVPTIVELPEPDEDEDMEPALIGEEADEVDGEAPSDEGGEAGGDEE